MGKKPNGFVIVNGQKTTLRHSRLIKHKPYNQSCRAYNNGNGDFTGSQVLLTVPVQIN